MLPFLGIETAKKEKSDSHKAQNQIYFNHIKIRMKIKKNNNKKQME